MCFLSIEDYSISFNIKEKLWKLGGLIDITQQTSFLQGQQLRKTKPQSCPRRSWKKKNLQIALIKRWLFMPQTIQLLHFCLDQVQLRPSSRSSLLCSIGVSSTLWITWRAHRKSSSRRNLWHCPSLKVHLSIILDSKKKFLMLDLDETLIHSVFTSEKTDVTFTLKGDEFKFNVRPYCF